MKAVKLLLLFLLTSVSTAAISELGLRAYSVSSDYLHIYQDHSLLIEDNAATIVTVDIGGFIQMVYDSDTGSTNVLNGDDYLSGRTFTGSKSGAVFALQYRVISPNPFIQDHVYRITVDTRGAGSSDSVTRNVTYNEQFVIQTFNIRSNDDYFWDDAGVLWFKGGISGYPDAEGLTVTGVVSYRYESQVFPSVNVVYVKAKFDGIANGEQSYVGPSGEFSLSHFVVPSSASGVSRDVIFGIQLQNVSMYTTGYPDTRTIQIDNQTPELNNLTFGLVADSSDNGGDGILPLTGWYDQVTVDVKLGSLGEIDDQTGVGVATTFSVQSQYETVLMSSSDTVNVQVYPGLNREIIATIFDRVHNSVTISVRVSVDTLSPETFTLSLGSDQTNSANQVTADTGWFNDETVEISWSTPNDEALRSAPYQVRSSLGWVTWSAEVFGRLVVDDFQTTNSTTVLEVSEGGATARTVYVRAIDKAGNVRVVNKSVYVDTTGPVIQALTLVPDTTQIEGYSFPILPALGWYNESGVHWQWTVVDNGALPASERFQYRNLNGVLNIATSNWTSATDVTIQTSEAPTGNVFLLRARDKAGNVSEATSNVYVDLTSPSFNMFSIVFVTDNTDTNGDGVLPEAGWYDQSTLDIVITWNLDQEDGQLWKLYLMRASDITYVTQDVTSPTFSSFTISPRDSSPIDIIAMIVDRSGRIYSKTSQVYADIQKPLNLSVALNPDSDDRSDGIAPMTGWYDDDTIDLTIYPPSDAGGLRASPYQLKLNNNDWSAAMSGTSITNFKVSANQANLILVRCMDKAGNVVTTQFTVTVDTQIPSGSFDLQLIADSSTVLGVSVTPDPGWYNDENVLVSFMSVDVSDNFGLREAPFYLKTIYSSYSNGSQVSQNVTINMVSAGSTPQNIQGAIVDFAGNVVQDTTYVYVDTEAPDNSFYIDVLADSTDGDGNGILPLSGWYDDESVDLEWNQATDGAGRLHNTPYRLRAQDSSSWTDFQSLLFYNDLSVAAAGSRNRTIYIQVRDTAGNLATANALVKVDTSPPTISLLEVVSQAAVVDADLARLGVTLPRPRWFNTMNITISWASGVVDDGTMVTAPYRVKASTGQTDYSAFTSNTTALIRVSSDQGAAVNLYLFALDSAGNSQVTYSPVFVDTQAPSVTMSYRVEDPGRLLPYVNSGDVLTISLDISESIVVTPFVAYYPTQNEAAFITIDSLAGSGLNWAATLSMEDVDIGEYSFKVVIFDNAGNKTNHLQGQSFFIRIGNNPSRATDFYAFDGVTLRQDLTNKGWVYVTFSVDSAVEKYYLTEDSGLTRSVLANYPGLYPFENLATSDYRWFFANGVNNERKTAYLWVKDNKGNISELPAVCSINFDDTPPLVKIKPNRTNPTPQDGGGTSFYNNVKVGNGEYFAEMEIYHRNEWTVTSNYHEQLTVTPTWILHFEGRSPVTMNSFLNTAVGAHIPSSPSYRARWIATYNTYGLSQQTTGSFTIAVTDNALNATTSIYVGGTFTVMSNAPADPYFSIYSTDLRPDYTNSLTINYAISKSATGVNYTQYGIVDGVEGNPGISALNRIWSVDVASYNGIYRIETAYTADQVAEGRKLLSAWVANEGIMNTGIVQRYITYDATAPTADIQIQEPLGVANEELRVTVFVSEPLESSPTPTFYVLGPSGPTVYHQTTISDTGLRAYNGSYVYSGTIIIPEIIAQASKRVRLVVSDRAGNILDETTPFLKQLVVHEYKAVHSDTDTLEVGSLKNEILRCVVSSNERPIHLAGLRIKITGQYVGTEIDSIYLYSDGDGDGQFREAQGYDTFLGEWVPPIDQNGEVLLRFDQEEIVESTTTKGYFVVLNMSNSAVPGHTMKFSFVSGNAFSVGPYEEVNYDEVDQSFETSVLTIINQISRVTLHEVDNSSGIPTTVNLGQQGVLVKKFKLSTDLGAALFKGLKVNLDAQFGYDRITRIAIYKDSNQNLVFDEDVDALISSGTDYFSNGYVVTIDLVYNQPIGDQTSIQFLDTYFIVADFHREMDPFISTCSFVIVSTDGLIVNTPNTVLATTFPFQSPLFTMGYYISQIEPNILINSGNHVVQGEGIVLMKMKFDVDFENPQWTYIKLVHEGNLDRQLYNNVEIIKYPNASYFQDSNFSVEDAVKVETVKSWGNNDEYVQMTFAAPETLVTTNVYGLAVTVDASASPGKLFKFKAYLYSSNATQNQYIGFTLGELTQDKVATSSEITVVNRLLPSSPSISGDYYISNFQWVTINFSSEVVPQADPIMEVKYSIGTTEGGMDVVPSVTEALPAGLGINGQNRVIVNQPLRIGGLLLNDNTVYYLSFRTRSFPGYFSIPPGTFSFKTDFSAPVEQARDTEVIVEQTGGDEISHIIEWYPFVEDQSLIRKYVIEERVGLSPRWQVISHDYVEDPRSVNLNSKERFLVTGRIANRGYKYRIKAVNFAGLESNYIYTDTVSTVLTTSVLSNVSNYPNPFHSRRETTRILYFLNRDTTIEIKIYDSLGHFVRKFYFTAGTANKSSRGECEIEWDGRNEAGEFVQKGGYFVVIEAPGVDGDNTKVVRMVGVIH